MKENTLQLFEVAVQEAATHQVAVDYVANSIAFMLHSLESCEEPAVRNGTCSVGIDDRAKAT